MSLESTRFASRFIVSSSYLLAKLKQEDFDGTCTAVCSWIMNKLEKIIDIRAVNIDRNFLLRHIPNFKYRGHDLLWLPCLNLYYDPTAMQLGLHTPLIFSKSTVPLVYGCKHYNIIEYNNIWATDKIQSNLIQRVIKARPHTKKVLLELKNSYDSCMSAWSLSNDDIKTERLYQLIGSKENNETFR